MEIAIILALYVLIILFDFVPIIKTSKKRVIFVYTILLMVSFSILFITYNNIKVPSPTTFIEKIIDMK